MECTAFRRIKEELKDFKKTNDNTSKIEFLDDDWSNLKAEITGPTDTPYEGGKFKLDIKIPPRYPFVGPAITFTTKIWHPNISFTSGYICLDILNDAWSASMTLRTTLLSIQALMSSPEPLSPEETIAAELYIKSRTLYELAAQHWTHIYANGPKPDVDFGQEIENQLLSRIINERLANVLLAYYNTYTNGHQTTCVTLEQNARTDNIIQPSTVRRPLHNREMIITVEAHFNGRHSHLGHNIRNRGNHHLVNGGNCLLHHQHMRMRRRNQLPRVLVHRRRRIIIRERVLLPALEHPLLHWHSRGRIMRHRSANYVIHHITNMLRHRRHAFRTFILRHL